MRKTIGFLFLGPATHIHHAASIAFELAPTTPDEYDRIIRKQMEIFARVAKQAGIQVN